MSEQLNFWWTALCVVSVANFAAWIWSALALNRRQSTMSQEEFRGRRWLLVLSAAYVAGCAYRSFFPVFDIPRLCLVDTWLSSAVVGRSVATIAELCFVGQWALMLRQTSVETDSRIGALASRALVPTIAIAEACSWYAVLTTSNLGHVIEESLWGGCAALLVISLIECWPRCTARARPPLALWCAVGMVYVVFMFAIDVPMYWMRWLDDEAIGRGYLSVEQGLLDISTRWIVSHRWDDWKGEVVWMSLYFSVAVWLSIALVLLPWPGRHASRTLTTR